MDHKDGFVVFSDYMGGTLAKKPEEDFPTGEINAQSFAEIYNLREDVADAMEDLQDRLGDPTNILEEKLSVLRARVFEDGSMTIYHAPENGALTTPIGPEEEGFARFTHFDIMWAQNGLPLFVEQPKFGAGEQECLVEIRITDQSEFYDYLGNDPAHARPHDMMKSGLFERFDRKRDFGAELMSIRSAVSDDGIMKVLLTVHVDDPDLFNVVAASAGRETGRDNDWSPENAAEAIFDAWCAANDSPSPDLIGIEFTDVRSPTPEDMAELDADHGSPFSFMTCKTLLLSFPYDLHGGTTMTRCQVTTATEDQMFVPKVSFDEGRSFRRIDASFASREDAIKRAMRDVSVASFEPTKDGLFRIILFAGMALFFVLARAAEKSLAGQPMVLAAALLVMMMFITLALQARTRIVKRGHERWMAENVGIV